MNVLSDFEIRLNDIIPMTGTEELVRMNKIIAEKESLIQKYKMELKLLSTKQKTLTHPLPKAAAKDKPAKKTPVKAGTKKTPASVKTATGKKPQQKNSK